VVVPCRSLLIWWCHLLQHHHRHSHLSYNPGRDFDFGPITIARRVP
jgi:hypothetical protein